jgi:hypothetical protein
VSTILKALRRLEEEKTRGNSARPLREEVASGPSEPPRGRRLPWLPLAAMLFVGLGLGASAWYVWPYERGGEPVRGEVAAASPSAAPAEVASAPPVQPPVDVAALPASAAEQPATQDELRPLTAAELEALQQEDAAPAEAFASQVEVVERPAPEPRIAPAPARPAPAAATPPPVAGPPRIAAAEPQHGLPEPAGVMARRAQAQQEAPAEKRPPGAKPVAAEPAAAAPRAPEPSEWEEPAEPEPAPAAVASAPTPVRAPVSAPAEEPAPELRVRRTQWHPDKARRSAEVELGGRSESVREGDLVGEYVVSEIRPSGVVLTHDGERIERGIGQ